MLTTIRNWLRNGSDQLSLIWSEPFSLIVVLFGATWATLSWRSGESKVKVVSIAAVTIWAVAALSLTIYPLDRFEWPEPGRFELKNFVPFWGLGEAIADADGYLMSEEEWMRQREQLAEEMGIPVEQVNLDRRVHGPGLTVVLKDLIGNFLLFVPLGLIAAAGWRERRSWMSVAKLGAATSGAIELSQALFGLSSVGTVDDVIFNTAGALGGLALWRAARWLLAISGSRVGAAA